jgi:hypothetical protein
LGDVSVHPEAIAADAFRKAHLNGRTAIPEKEWRAERENLPNERYVLVDEFYKLKEDVRNIETLRRGAENIMRENPPERTQPARAHGMEL